MDGSFLLLFALLPNILNSTDYQDYKLLVVLLQLEICCVARHA